MFKIRGGGTEKHPTNINDISLGFTSGNYTYTCESDFAFFNCTLAINYELSGYGLANLNGNPLIEYTTVKGDHTVTNVLLKKGDVVYMEVNTSSNASRYSAKTFDMET